MYDKRKEKISPRKVGFWWSKDEPHLPMPEPDTCTLTESGRLGLLEYLRSGSVLVRYRGASHCRLSGHAGCDCDDRLDGSGDLTDGVWVWPEALPHYVEVHRVALPSEFVEHALAQHLAAQLKYNPENE